jgi:hypothetical protein
VGADLPANVTVVGQQCFDEDARACERIGDDGAIGPDDSDDHSTGDALDVSFEREAIADRHHGCERERLAHAAAATGAHAAGAHAYAAAL